MTDLVRLTPPLKLQVVSRKGSPVVIVREQTATARAVYYDGRLTHLEEIESDRLDEMLEDLKPVTGEWYPYVKWISRMVAFTGFGLVGLLLWQVYNAVRSRLYDLSDLMIAYEYDPETLPFTNNPFGFLMIQGSWLLLALNVLLATLMAQKLLLVSTTFKEIYSATTTIRTLAFASGLAVFAWFFYTQEAVFARLPVVEDSTIAASGFWALVSFAGPLGLVALFGPGLTEYWQLMDGRVEYLTVMIHLNRTTSWWRKLSRRRAQPAEPRNAAHRSTS